MWDQSCYGNFKWKINFDGINDFYMRNGFNGSSVL